MRMLNSRPQIPNYLDELANLFGGMPKRESIRSDQECTLFTALVETGEGLEEAFNKDQRPGDRHSMVADLRRAP